MKYFISLILVMIIFSCSGLKEIEQNKIRIKGSDTMLLLNKKLAEEFMIKNEGISVYVDGGGSGTGIKALMKSEVEICAASRPLEPEEIKQIGEKFNTVGMSFLIGRDALSLYVNPENNVKDLSVEEINKIFSCQIKNWKEVGGLDEKIIPISRSSASGTHLYFVKHVLKGVEINEYTSGNELKTGSLRTLSSECTLITKSRAMTEITKFLTKNFISA